MISRQAKIQLVEPAGSRIAWRIGTNVGDVIVEDGDIFGDGGCDHKPPPHLASLKFALYAQEQKGTKSQREHREPLR